MATTVEHLDDSSEPHERTPGIRLSPLSAGIAALAIATASILGYRVLASDSDTAVSDPAGLDASDSLQLVPDIQGIEGIDVDGERVGVTNFQIVTDTIKVNAFFGAVVNYMDSQEMGSASNYLAPSATMTSLDGRLQFAEAHYLGAGDTEDGGSNLFVLLDGRLIGTGPFIPDAAVQVVPLMTQGGQNLVVSTNVMPGHTPE